jgi:preprotein translocase subunit SecA
MERLGMEEDVPIEAGMVSRAIENAQRKVEGRNFDMRKHLLEYDDVMNKQREIVYARRRAFLNGTDLRQDVLEMVDELADGIVAIHVPTDKREVEFDTKALEDAVFAQFRFHLGIGDEKSDSTPTQIKESLVARAAEVYAQREEEFGTEVVRHLERVITLQAIDGHWKDHLLAMDHLKEGIGLRGYGQRNPLQEYQREGFDMFAEMLGLFEADIVEKLFSVQIATENDVARMEERRRQAEQQKRLVMAHAKAESESEPEPQQTVKREVAKVGRNDECPCGSGKKYKKCHGRS